MLYGALAFIMLVLLAALVRTPNTIHTTRPSLRAPSALRGGSSGATMTIPGEARTPPKHCNLLRARLIGFSHRVGASASQTPAFRFAPSRCPNPLSGPTPHGLRIIPGDEGAGGRLIPLIGVGLCRA